MKLEFLELRVHTLNFYKNYQFRLHTANGVEANYASVAAEMTEDFKDYVMREMLKLVGEQNNETEDDDSAIVNYVMNSFEFS